MIRKGKIFQNVAALNFIRAARPSPSHQSDANKDSSVTTITLPDAQIDSSVAPTRDDPVVSLQLPSSSLVVLSSPSASPARPPTSPLQLLAELFDSDSDDEHRDPFAYVDALRLPLPDVE